MTFPTYEEWCEKVAEQAIDGYIINGRTIREWIEILSDELTMLDKIRAEIDRQEKWLSQAGYTPYNTDIAFDAIKSVLAERSDKE